MRAITEQQERLQCVEREPHEAVKGCRLYPVVEAIQALRGVELTGAARTGTARRRPRDS